MPFRRQPKSLTELAEEKLGTAFLSGICTVHCREVAEIMLSKRTIALKQQIGRYFRSLPTKICNDTIEQIARLYVDECREYDYMQISNVLKGITAVKIEPPPRVPSIHKLFRFLVIGSNVTRLDFSTFIRAGTVFESAMLHFHDMLNDCLKRVPNLLHLSLQSPNYKTSLPAMKSEHLVTMAYFNNKLEYLNISFNRPLKNDYLLHLIPYFKHGCAGCPNLEKIYFYDCSFSHKAVVILVRELPRLKDVGYKEMGKVLSIINRDIRLRSELKLDFRHINHIGRETMSHVPSLRCRNVIVEAIQSLCPNVENLKIRCKDSDVAYLRCLANLKSLELLYNDGSARNVGDGLVSFLELRGVRLTSLAIICANLNLTNVATIGENCPNLTALWLRSNHFQSPKQIREDIEPKDFPRDHNYFFQLRTLYFRVGENELSVAFVTPFVIHYILTNGQSLTDLTLAMRTHIFSDTFMVNLFLKCNVSNLEKLQILLPANNNLPGVFPLSVEAIEAILANCPNIRMIGNLLSWSVAQTDEHLKNRMLEIERSNCHVEFINRKMTFH